MCCFCLYGVLFFFCHAIMELQYFTLYYFVNMLNIINWLNFLFNGMCQNMYCATVKIELHLSHHLLIVRSSQWFVLVSKIYIILV